ncbi:MAG: hypothetical protein JXN59_03235, partial [Anaerolineae bacterium]|nr:hypothetical protein [Anaerolineae bacterium]
MAWIDRNIYGGNDDLYKLLRGHVCSGLAGMTGRSPLPLAVFLLALDFCHFSLLSLAAMPLVGEACLASCHRP